VCEHLKLSGKQGTFARSRFLDACRACNRGELTQTQLIEQTARLESGCSRKVLPGAIHCRNNYHFSVDFYILIDI
jgi:hypothetical protein